MPRKKKPQEQMQEVEDFQMRSHIEDTSICLTPTSKDEIPIMHSLPQEAHYETPDVSLNYFGVKELFSSRTGCYTSSRIEAHTPLHAITQTPQISPFKRTDSSWNSAACVEDLNNLQGMNVQQRGLSCSRTINRVRLEHLRQFNDIIQNTSQGECLESSCAVDNDTEHSFYTPSLLQCNFTSTPSVANIQMVQMSSSQPTLSRRRTYKTSESVKFPPMKRISNEHSFETCTIEVYTHNSSKLEKFNKKYQLFIQVIELCMWLWTTLKEGLISVYNLYSTQYFTHSVCNNCIKYHNKITELTSSVENLHSEMLRMREENKKDWERMRDDNKKDWESVKQQLLNLEQNRRDLVSTGAVAPVQLIPPPPPPPPPPVLVPPTVPVAVSKTKLVDKKKPREIVQPIISLDDILKVKLKKVSDPPSSKFRRATEPNLVSSVKTLRPIRRQNSLMSTSVTPDNLSSSLLRMLSSVDTGSHKVKRLQRSNSSPQFKRERE
ncbi:hypothetical protein PPYR_10076 [Photinus pyralis]|uniref:Uncharacterized protein n=1 Tax=Photinus pyralis TaxID=7054 RepID=A0A5N4AFA7_PHOPY|nr:uncharacterized protein LOC116174043 [Photinus pyralis]XP_031347681.1 uncharacterized protein LOC116174043 [Photinus pyralis]KAB0796015.1 hypothetical protein PPYR_10076 [Photinus pyralis]